MHHKMLHFKLQHKRSGILQESVLYMEQATHQTSVRTGYGQPLPLHTIHTLWHSLPACSCAKQAHLCLVLYLLHLPAQLLNVLVEVHAELLYVLLPLTHCLVNGGAQTGDSRTQGLCESTNKRGKSTTNWSCA